MLLFHSKHYITEGSLASKERGRFKMSTGLHMTYDLLLCLFSQNTDRKKEGVENPEDSELKYTF